MRSILLLVVASVACLGQLNFAQNAVAPTMNNRWHPAETSCPDVGTNGFQSFNNVSAASFGAVDFTVAVWVYTTAKLAANHVFFGKDYNGLGYGAGYLNSSSQNAWYFEIRNNGAFTSTGTITNGTWNLLIGRQTASATHIYISVNGAAFNAGVSWGSGTNTGATPFQVGNNSSNDYACKAGVWSRSFTNADAAALYNNGVGYRYSQLPSSLLTNLVAYWDMSVTPPMQGGTVPSASQSAGGILETTNVTSSGSWFAPETQFIPSGSTIGGPGFGRPQTPCRFNMVWMGDSQTDPNGHLNSWAQYMAMTWGAQTRNYCYNNFATSGATLSTMTTVQLPQAQAQHSSSYSQNILFLFSGTNDSGGANMTSAIAANTSLVSSLHSAGYKVVQITAPPTGAAGFWSGTNRTVWNQYLCGGSWTASGTPITCSGGTSGADLVLDVGNIAALQTPSDATHYYADQLHWTGATTGSVTGGGKWNVAQFVTPLVLAWLGL